MEQLPAASMNYLFLVYQDEDAWNAMSASEHDAVKDASLACEEELWQSGHVITAAALTNNHTPVTIQSRDSTLFLTDTPPASGQGTLRRLLLVNARDLNEAVRLAERVSHTGRAIVEVRPLQAILWR